MSASDAAAALEEFRPNVVLSDIAIPERDGFAVVAEVRASEAQSGPHVPIVSVTAYARNEDRERVISAEFDEYVAEPVDPAALVLDVAPVAAGVSR